MLARRRHARVDHGRDFHVHVGALREAAELGVVVRLLQVVDTGADPDHALQEGRVLHGRELGCGVKRQIHLARRAAELELVDGAYEIVGQVLLVDEFAEGDVGIGAGDDRLGVDLVAIFESDAHGAAFLHDHLLHRGADPDLGSVTARHAGECFADPTGAAFL